jgi:parallel beta-helix repeat protein
LGSKTFRLAALLALIVVANLVPRTAGAATGFTPTPAFCGMSVFESIRVTADPMAPCQFNGLIVAEDDITIDLNGHTITGNQTNDLAETEYGVGTTSGFPHTNIRIVNGTVTGFEAGVHFAGGSGLTVKNMRSTGNGEGIQIVSGTDVGGVVLSNNALWKNSSDGVEAHHSPGIAVVGNVATGNGDDGIELVEIEGGATVERNVAGGNGDFGIHVAGATKGRVSGNDASRNVNYGIGIEQSGPVVVASNLAAGNGESGLVLAAAGGTILKENRTLGNDSGISVFGTTDVQVVGNTASGNGIGIDVEFSVGTRVLANGASGNRVVGIFVEGEGQEVGGNIADGNGYSVADGTGLGIDASFASDLVRSFALNAARGNDDTDECDPFLLCKDNTPASSSDLPLTTVDCQDVITTSIRLRNDLSGCPGNGLIANKSGITIDLNGHTIDGDDVGQNYGVFVGFVNDVTIRGGRISDFEDGVNVTSAKRIVIRNMSSISNEGRGLFAEASSDVTIAGGFYARNGDAGIEANDIGGLVVGGVVAAGDDIGIRVLESDGAQVTRSTATGNDVGLSIGQSVGSLVTRNTVSGNFANGILVTASASSVISRNVVGGNGSNGIEVDVSERSRIAQNVISGNTGNGVTQHLGRKSIFADNRASGNVVAGIDTHGADSKRLTGNTTHGNGGDGITTIGVSVLTIDDNTAHGNGFTPAGIGNGAGSGILAGTTPLSFSGNRARGNDNPTQCRTTIGALTCS